MVGDPGRHRRRLLLAVIGGEAGMRGAKVRDRAHQIHPAYDGGNPAGRAARAPTQGCETTPEGAVQPFDGGRIEHLTAGGAPQQRQKALNAAMHQPMDGAGDGSSRILRNHLSDGQVGPAHQPGATAGARLARPKGFPYHVNVRAQPIGDKQQRPPLRAGGHDGDQTSHQIAIPMGADRTAQPQPGADHHHHRHPHHARLGLDMNLIRLHLHQITWLDHLGVMDGFGMGSTRLHPLPHGLRLEAIGHLNRRDRTAMADQGDNTGDRLLVRAPTVEHRPRSGTEGFLADLAPVALTFLAMDGDIPFADLPSCRAVHIRAACRLRIDGTPPRF